MRCLLAALLLLLSACGFAAGADYIVRGEDGSQVGSFVSLRVARRCADARPGCAVYDSEGRRVLPGGGFRPLRVYGGGGKGRQENGAAGPRRAFGRIA